MALGRTVLATIGTRFEQLIVDGDSGILVQPDDISALGNGLVRAWQVSDAQHAAYGVAAKVRIAELHPDRKVPELVEYFSHIIAKYSTVTING